MPWSRTSRHARGYGKAHDAMRAHMIATVILCEECTRHGRTAIGTIADHIKPLSQGGSSSRANYQLLCKSCSDAKTLADRGAKAKALIGGTNDNGIPTDPRHPWNASK
jgi:5-methylcytosine-specific restriction protein A